MAIDILSIAGRIRARRKYLRLTQAEIAGRLYMSLSNYSRFEKGEINFAAEHLIKVAGILGCSVSYLLGEDDEELSQDERDIVRWYRGVPEPGKRAISASAKSMHDAYEGQGFDGEGESDDEATIGKRAE